MRNVLVTFMLASLCTACAPPGKSSGDCPDQQLPLAASCAADSWYGGQPCNPCPGAACVSGAASGQVTDAYGEGPVSSTMCTVTCSSTAECAGLDYLYVNSYSASENSQSWSCTSLGGKSYCTVVLATGGGGGGDPCSQCLSSCQGYSGCCTGCGCMCQSACGGTC